MAQVGYAVAANYADLPGFQPVVDVVTCVMDCGGVLFLRRAAHVLCPATWAIPGGKVEAGESLSAALIRELHEELALRLTTDQLGTPVALCARAPSCDYRLFVYRLTFAARPEIQLTPQEHDAYRWCTAAQERDLTMLPNQNDTLVLVRAQWEAGGR